MADFNYNFSGKYANALTKEGEHFIKEVCKGTGTKMISGNNGRMPYTDPPINKTWTANMKRPTNNPLGFSMITTGEEYAEALIYWFNKYAEEFGIDANVVAAQAYCESHFKAWIYVKYINNSSWQSTASGISQFLMGTAYGIMIKNDLGAFTQEEIQRISKGLDKSTEPYPTPVIQTSFEVGGNTDHPSEINQIAWNNRPIFHQNLIDNTDLVIKAQCVYLKSIARKCDSLTSSTLFGYSRGPDYVKDSYPKTVADCTYRTQSNPKYVQEGLNYVLRIFGVLGDKNNLLGGKSGLGKGYKPLGLYFGYDDTKVGPKNLKLYDPFNPFNTTLG